MVTDVLKYFYVDARVSNGGLDLDLTCRCGWPYHFVNGFSIDQLADIAMKHWNEKHAA